MKIKGLSFICTCSICPEQYEVFDSNGKMVGYVRLRWGELRCDYPDVGGETIYHTNIGNEWTGWFLTDDERMELLQNIADKILEKLEGCTKEIEEHNEKMKNESDKHSEYMEMKNMYEEGLLER